MTAEHPEDPNPSESLGSPDEDRGGATVDEAVAAAESGSRVEGAHRLSGQPSSGESRVEQMPAVDGVTEGRTDGDPGEQVTAPKP
jgi:hypothetical protein